MNNKEEYYIEDTKTANGERMVPMLLGVETVLREMIQSRSKLSKEPVVWNKEHTISAADFVPRRRAETHFVAQKIQRKISTHK